MPEVIEIPRGHNPFSTTGVTRDPDGILRYEDLPATLLDMLAEQVERRPGSEAVVEVGAGRLTYRQLWDRAARVAGGLRAAGLQPADRVAVRYPAGINWVLAFWGTVMAGGIAVAVNTRSAQPEIEFVLSDAGARVDLSADTPLPDGLPYVAEGLTPLDTAALFYTSGTTGHPKGVPTTHEAFVTNTENCVRCMGFPPHASEELRTLISVPLFHVTGCNTQLLVAVRLGGASVIMPTLNLDELTATLSIERISQLVTVPAIYALLLRHKEFHSMDISGVRWVGYGGAPIAPSLVRSVKNAFPQAKVFNGYGMTESASLMTVLPDSDAVEHADSVGYAVPTVDLGVIPSGDDAGVGELVARGANLTAGYWNRPQASEEAIIDGWLHTGDVVRVDDAGRVHIVDRLKDIINRGGENVSSVEVEAVLLAAPNVADACVLAVPDEVMGEKVGAVLFGGAAQIDVPAVLEHCSGQLADYKLPQYVTVVSEALPRNAGGKLLKARLRGEVQWGDPLR
ncbi:class I adenylate-forming enzyme family protein [Mycobacterium montefiorense]|uniref:O-succinylbenzoic acid--CoA ligase n=1 Tax=Mycobacterium montefiorense TaxID=154654 RepID=A0AA37PRM4_9MYCO|nr:class I adenylate-forming enzyme family protein [Mycobacterium montefiorense]GBG35754.1 O-succinylbenzoic acid--CoA ligase [Mycobacterium montefiorense]GKU35903.1 O-succinylbenzoic acid--CoA ligase [Mycobacterium montefiorense]GKU41510.1 O-succinylbenzoic acid--CoA ligase [Mycobacterium montefiorense]GKU44344.1 O-succinylbenzoic acid--CoA ligase [Mycobacterium montefiorense]GKU51848.1 O-succinylbenzoic acid--CoA ligase [Mycobacterium montefiorense]